jgi:hypothetical protein
VNATVACALPAVAVPMVGAPGTPWGVTLFEGAEAAPVPTELVALTVNVYDVPLVRPVTVQGDVAHVPVCPPEDVAVYERIVAPPLLPGGVKLTVAWPLPAVAVPIVGAPGALRTRTLLDAADAALEPTEFTATTVKVYDVPPARPVTLIDVHGALQNPVTPPGEDVAT